MTRFHEFEPDELEPDELEALPGIEIEEAAPRTLLVRLRGDLDATAVAALRAALDDELAQTPASCLLLDLSRATLLGSAALTLLLALHRQCRAENRHLVLIGTACPAVNRPLRISGLLPLFDTRVTVQAALHRPYTPCPSVAYGNRCGMRTGTGHL